MAEQKPGETKHNTIWRCDAAACRLVADIYDREAARQYRDLLNVMAAEAEPGVRFEVVPGAGFWKGYGNSAAEESGIRL